MIERGGRGCRLETGSPSTLHTSIRMSIHTSIRMSLCIPQAGPPSPSAGRSAHTSLLRRTTESPSNPKRRTEVSNFEIHRLPQQHGADGMDYRRIQLRVCWPFSSRTVQRCHGTGRDAGLPFRVFIYVYTHDHARVYTHVHTHVYCECLYLVPG